VDDEVDEPADVDGGEEEVHGGEGGFPAAEVVRALVVELDVQDERHLEMYRINLKHTPQHLFIPPYTPNLHPKHRLL